MACYSRNQRDSHAQPRHAEYAACSSFKMLVAVSRALDLPAPSSAGAADPHPT
jgi:hypothetical protein